MLFLSDFKRNASVFDCNVYFMYEYTTLINNCWNVTIEYNFLHLIKLDKVLIYNYLKHRGPFF